MSQNHLPKDKVEVNESSTSPEKYHKLKAGVFMTSLFGMSILGGFGFAMSMVKKQDPQHFNKGFVGSKEIPESGVSLATRALARGTLYSLTGFSLFCFAVWKLMGVHSLPEFKEKLGSKFPKIPKKDDPGRGDFKTLRDLYHFLLHEDEKKQREKQSKEEANGPS